MPSPMKKNTLFSHCLGFEDKNDSIMRESFYNGKRICNKKKWVVDVGRVQYGEDRPCGY